MAKAIRIKRKGGRKKRKSGKEREGGNDCFTMTDTCSRARLITTSLNSYAFYEFPAFFRPVPDRYSYTRFQSTRLNYAHVRPSARNEDK